MRGEDDGTPEWVRGAVFGIALGILIGWTLAVLVGVVQ